MPENGLNEQHELEVLNGIQVVRKQCDADAFWNELFFQAELNNHNLPNLRLFDSKSSNEILMEFVPEGTPNLNTSFMHTWGTLMQKVHAITYQNPFYIAANNTITTTTWTDHLRERMRIAQGKKALQSELEAKIVSILESTVLQAELKQASLIHGDLHSNNVLVRNGELVLFDSSPYIRSGDPLYDLAITWIGFAADTYVNIKDPKHEGNKKLLAAFIDGYGADKIKKHQATLDLYVLMRSFERYPNPYEPQLKQIMQHLVHKHS